jgi:tetratricopeptide (TPR) repeat protein
MPEGTYWCPFCGKLNATLRVRTVFILLVFVIICGFAVAKSYVSYLRRLESTLAQRWLTRGDTAMARNFPAVAINDYRNALAYDSTNRQYRLMLAEALFKEGLLAEARANLVTLWSQDPANGRLNLDLARLHAQQKQPDLAVRYYRAAIDGVWPNDPLKQRLDARFELVRYLMQRGDKARATAELIAVEAEALDDPAALTEAGNLLLQLDENGRAAKSYELALKQDAKNETALLGGGQASLAMGDYPTAVRLLTMADELSSAKGQGPAAAQLALTQRALKVDPYLRNLTVAERANRVAAVFTTAMGRLKSCASQENVALAPQPLVSAPKTANPVLPNEQNGYRVPLAPPAAAPDSLQMLYNRGMRRQPAATADALRKNPDAMAPTMDFVLDVMHATQNDCPLTTMPERALQSIAQHEAESPR